MVKMQYSRNDRPKKHQLSLVLVCLFSPATNGSLVLMQNRRLSLVTVSREDRPGPTTTDVFWSIISAIISHGRYADESRSFLRFGQSSRSEL